MDISIQRIKQDINYINLKLNQIGRPKIMLAQRYGYFAIDQEHGEGVKTIATALKKKDAALFIRGMVFLIDEIENNN